MVNNIKPANFFIFGDSPNNGLFYYSQDFETKNPGSSDPGFLLRRKARMNYIAAVTPMLKPVAATLLSPAVPAFVVELSLV
jgi:hypothetical protein